ncbi:hypothetical protein BDFB_012142 [Asbolus verrucosus]|uniref:Uncharacterized protein n=1 Tax=Asbolus verrucosus TaxID=1661398 RepID=A0A482VUN8_ASBVE|nr:hypothetical protein BDFB_012142 [Asbolus verrucosus]
MNSEQNSTVDEPLAEMQAGEELETSKDMEQISKDLEDFFKSQLLELEQEMTEIFYIMRKGHLRKFTDLIENINKHWDKVMKRLKLTESQGDEDGNGGVHSSTDSQD